MRRNHGWVIRGMRALTALALMLSVVPLGTVSAAPRAQVDSSSIDARPVVAASTAVEQIRAGRSTRGSNQVEAAPAAVPPQTAPQAPNAVNLVATKRDAIVNDVDGDGRADPGDTLRYTVVITNSGDTDATSVVFNDTIDDHTVLSGTIKSTPLARNDSYTAVGNVRISVSEANGVLANDNDPDGSVISVTTYSSASANGGNVAMNTDGGFTYNPPPGYEGSDTFTYTIQDTDGNQDSATVTVTVSGMIWFIDNNAGACSSGCDGRLTSPFTTLAAFAAINNGTGNNPAANDNIFVYESAAAYAGGVTLLNGQRLIGQDATGSLAALAGVTPPAYSDPLPAMNMGAPAATINGGTNAVTLAQNNALYGFTAGTAAGASVSGNSFGTLLVNDVIVNTTGAGLSLITGTFGSPATFTSITSSGGTNNVSLASVNGTVNLGSGVLSAATGNAFDLNGGTASVTYSGTINNTAARSVSVANKTGGTVTFAGAVSGTGTGVLLNANTGATINFSGGVNLSTGANAAFTAMGGGTVSVSGSNNALTTTTATALNVVNTTIGASGLTFRSITSNGGSATGVILDTTGSSGGLTVTGSGAAGSGGTIANKTGANGSTSTGIGFYLNSTNNVSLSYLQLNDFQNFAIRGNNVNGFTLTNTVINGANGNSATGGSEEASLHIDNLTGSASLASCNISGGYYDNVYITTSSGALNRLTVSATTIGANSTAAGNDGLHLEALNNATLNVSVLNSFFTSARGDLVQTIARNNSTMDIVFTGNTLSNNHPNIVSGGGGAVFEGDAAGGAVSVTYRIANNSFRDAKGYALNVFKGAGNGSLNGTIANNTIGVLGASLSGSSQASGIQARSIGGGSFTTAILNNAIREYNAAGIELTTADGSSAVNATITGNTMVPYSGVDTFAFAGMFVDIGALTTDNGTTCADIGGAGALANSVSNGDPFNFGDIIINQNNSTTIRLPGYAGGPTNLTAVEAYLAGRNSGDGVPVVSAFASGSGGGFVGGAACTPPIAMLPSQPSVVKSEQDVAAPTAVLVQSVDFVASISGGNSKPLFSPVFVPALRPFDTPQANRLDAPITPLSIGTLPAGKTVTLTFDVVINDPVTPGVMQVSNQGTVSGGNFSPVLTDDPDTGAANDPTVTPLDIQVDLQVTKAVNPATAYPGLPITYTITYLNAGPQASTNVVITDPIPSALTGVAYQSSATITSTGSDAWAIGTLLNGQGGVITVTGTIDPALGTPTTITNTATITGTGRDTIFGNNTTNVGLPITDQPINGLSATDDSPTLLGSATHFTATISAGTNVVYQWNFGDGANGSGATPSHTYATVGTYTATVTATNSSTSQVATTSVTVIDVPVAGLTAVNDSPTRLGSVTSFTATIGAGSNVSYAWDFGDGVSGSGATPAHTYTAIGTYLAAVTATNSVNQQVATTVVNVIDRPISGLIAANDSPTQVGHATHFTATIDGGSNVVYHWSFGDGSFGSGASVSYTYGAVGAYVATVTATNGVSVVVATTSVSILDRAIVGLTATNSSPTGLGNTTAFTATIDDGTNVAYAWDFGDGNFASGATVAHTYAAVGAYTAIVTATNSSNVVTASTVATVINQPVTGLSAGNDGPTRLGSATTFTAAIATGSNVTYAWDFGDGATGSGANAAHTYAAVGTYTATVTATNILNSQTASTVVVVIDRAIVGLSAGNASPTRLGSTTAFTATIGDGSNVTYQWNFGDGSLGSGATTSHIYAVVGAYLATVTATNGVSVVVATTNVSIIDTPIVGLAAANSGPTGLGLSTALTATIEGGSNVVYHWNFGDGATGSSATTSHIYPALGEYTAIVTATNGVSKVVATTLVTIVDQPLTTLNAASSSPTLLGNTTYFTATADGTSVVYEWNFGDGATGAGANASHTYLAAGQYTAVITATNANGSLTTTVSVNVFSGRIYLPLIARQYVSAPDLVVTSLKAGPGNVQVVIQNQGDLPATDGFYVDVYINPNPVPTAVNQIWSDGRSAQGLTWGVISPLQPGQVLTLTIGDAYYLPDYSVFTGTLPMGTPVYAQVDSFNPDTTYGAVRENHEITGSPYNNILGPAISTAILAPLNVMQPIEKGSYWLPVRLKVQ